MSWDLYCLLYPVIHIPAFQVELAYILAVGDLDGAKARRQREQAVRAFFTGGIAIIGDQNGMAVGEFSVPARAEDSGRAAQGHGGCQISRFLPCQQCVKFTFAEQRNFPICQVVSTVQTVDIAAFDLLVFRCSIGTADFDRPQRSCCKPRDGCISS